MGASLQNKGGMRRGGISGGRRRARPMSEINVTPFVDVMLVLLIVFMVTAPLLTAGVKVDLPDASAKAVGEEDNKPLEIALTAAGEIFIGETKVEADRLANMMQAMTRNDPDRLIFIRADQALNYGDVMKTLGTLNAAGFRKMALLTEAQ